MVIVINTTEEGKGIDEAIQLLKENGYEAQSMHPIRCFCNEEAEHRITQTQVLSPEQKASLTKEQTESLISIVSDEFVAKEILDYDYMDDIIREEYELLLKNS